MAFRNLFRHRKRTIITALAIAIGLSMYILIDSMLTGIDQETIQNLVWYETASLRLYTDAYVEEREAFPLNKPIEYPEQVIPSLQEVYPVSPRTVFLAELLFFEDPYPVGGSVNAIVHAISPSDSSVFRTFEDLQVPKNDEIILGGWLAEDIGASIDYPITLLTRTRDGYYQTIDLYVKDIVYTPNQITNRAAFIALDYADAVLNMEGAVTEISIGLPVNTSIEDIDLIGASLAVEFPHLDGLSWRDQAADFVAIASTKQSSTGFILFLVFIIVAVGISNTILMAVQERKKEIGIMRALGMSKRQIRRLFLAEAGGLGVIGGLFSMVLGALFVLLLVQVGIDYTWIMRDIDFPYRTTGIIYGAVNIPTFFISFLFGIGISIIMAAIPVRRALKTTVTDTLKD